jgi:hypothetical protein
LDSTINTTDSHLRLREIKKTVVQLDSIFIKDRLNYISHQISKLEDRENQTELVEAETEYNQLLSELSKVQIKKS